MEDPQSRKDGASRVSASRLSAIAARIEQEEDHVTALELAGWIRERRPGLHVIDLRPPADFEAAHLPSAENRSLDDLLATRFGDDETVVLYSGGGTHAAQAWTLLAARGADHVFNLQGGFDAWLREVMNPELARDAAPEEAAEFARVAELSRYFGGVPRIVDRATLPPQASGLSAGELAARTRRRGC